MSDILTALEKYTVELAELVVKIKASNKEMEKSLSVLESANEKLKAANINLSLAVSKLNKSKTISLNKRLN